MEKEEKKKKKKIGYIIFAVIALAAFAVAEFFVVSSMLQKDPQSEPTPIETQNSEPVEKNEGTISIPGYEYLTLEANTKKQSICLQNPAENDCLFVISIVMDDGTVLWKSKETPPGYQTDVVVLSEELAPGAYENCIIKYECYSDDGNMTPYNGAETIVTIIAQ